MATQSIVMLCKPNCKLICFVTSKNAIFYCRSFISHQTNGENRKSEKANSRHFKEVKKYAAQFRILELNEDSDRETVRQQYIKLVKRYHPDAVSSRETPFDEKSLEKFHLIDEAYKDLQKLFASQAKSEEDCEGEYGLYYKVRLSLKCLTLSYLGDFKIINSPLINI